MKRIRIWVGIRKDLPEISPQAFEHRSEREQRKNSTRVCSSQPGQGRVKIGAIATTHPEPYVRTILVAVVGIAMLIIGAKSYWELTGYEYWHDRKQQVELLSSLSQWINQGTERLSDLPKFPQLVEDRFRRYTGAPKGRLDLSIPEPAWDLLLQSDNKAFPDLSSTPRPRGSAPSFCRLNAPAFPHFDALALAGPAAHPRPRSSSPSSPKSSPKVFGPYLALPLSAHSSL